MSVDTKELRSFHGWTSRTDSERLDMLRAAADCIESQAAEIERLRERLQGASNYIDTLGGVSKEYRAALSGEPA